MEVLSSSILVQVYPTSFLSYSLPQIQYLPYQVAWMKSLALYFRAVSLSINVLGLFTGFLHQAGRAKGFWRRDRLSYFCCRIRHHLSENGICGKNFQTTCNSSLWIHSILPRFAFREPFNNAIDASCLILLLLILLPRSKSTELPLLPFYPVFTHGTRQN